MKIGVVFTGGTIGSLVDEDGYIATKKENYTLIQKYREIYGETEEFVIRSPYTVLSENMTGNILEKLIECVFDLMKEKVDGIIVTHGTDTLQYSAAILGYVFSSAKIPIVLVSSNYVLDDKRANGFINFQYGMSFIKNMNGTGVFVSYCNQGDKPRIHRGTRLHGGLYYSDDVFSIKSKCYGSFEQDVFVKEENETDCNIHFFDVCAYESDKPQIHLKQFDEEIVVVHPYVGMSYPSLSKNTKVILHGSFHSGTINQGEGLITFAKKAKELGIPFYLIGMESERNQYETTKIYEQLQIIPLYDTSLVAQYCKAWLLLSNDLPLEKYMMSNVAYDHVI